MLNPTTMPKTINQLLVAIGGLTIVFGLLKRMQDPSSFAVLGTGIVLVIVGIVSDAYRSRVLARKRNTQLTNRIAELTKEPWTGQQILELRHSLWLTILMVLAGMACAGIVFLGATANPINWTITLITSVFLAGVALWLVRRFAGLGKPACKFDRTGFFAPIHGHISWHAVSGIYLLKN